MSNEEKRIVAETIDKLKQLPADLQHAVYYTAMGMEIAQKAQQAETDGDKQRA